MNNKLTIFWIEDNPIQSNVERKNGKQYPKFLHEEFISYCLFQHPKQVEEYLSMINVIKNTTPAWAEICQNSLPDIVVFDYKMADAFKNNQHALSYYDNEHNTYLQTKSVSHKIKDTFESLFQHQILFLDRNDVKEFEYGGDEFKKEIKASDIQIDDEFGLYCGIAIVREFKEYITVGVPATIIKTDKVGTMSYNSLFYEWINSYDLKGALDRPANADEMKDWSKILNFSTGLLRNRIEEQLRLEKITPKLTQLLAWASENPTDKEKQILIERRFTFQSAYGVRHLPLDALFIDVEADKRDEIIKKWVNNLLINFKTDAYKTAKDASTKLIEAYQAIPVIKNRIRLSELSVKLCNNEPLTDDENIELDKIKTEFGINDTQLKNCINNGDAEHSNLTNKVVEYRELKTNDNTANRLIVLFTDLQVHRVWQNFCKMNENTVLDGQIITLLKSRPVLDDLRAALFPIPKNPLVLPYHYHLLSDKSKFKSKDAFEVWDTHFGKNKMNDNAIFPKGDYPKNLSAGEKQLCKSFALDIGLENKYYPNWLMN